MPRLRLGQEEAEGSRSGEEESALVHGSLVLIWSLFLASKTRASARMRAQREHHLDHRILEAITCERAQQACRSWGATNRHSGLLPRDEETRDSSERRIGGGIRLFLGSPYACQLLLHLLLCGERGVDTCQWTDTQHKPNVPGHLTSDAPRGTVYASANKKESV